VAAPADHRNGHADIPISLLPQRNPGASGISDIPAAPIEPSRKPAEAVDQTGEPGWPQEDWPADEPHRWHLPVESSERPVPMDTSSFFAAKAHAAGQSQATPGPQHVGQSRDQPEAAPPPAAAGGSIFEKMLSEWLIDDPAELAKSTDLDWQTVWDHGWSAAVAAEEAPVSQHTEHGLPMRQPGARLVPGAAGAGDDDNGDDSGHDSVRNGGSHRGADVDEEQDSTADTGPIAIHRDPEAVRSSIGNHFSGVHAGRMHARDSARQGWETDQE
jgi:hypothetical protein